MRGRELEGRVRPKPVVERRVLPDGGEEVRIARSWTDVLRVEKQVLFIVRCPTLRHPAVYDYDFYRRARLHTKAWPMEDIVVCACLEEAQDYVAQRIAGRDVY